MGRNKRVAAASVVRRAAPPKHASAEERLRCVIELTADFYWEQDEEHRFTVYRPSGEPDAELAALVGKTSSEVSAEPPEGGWDSHRETLDARKSFHGLLLLLSLDGRVVI
jgi:hypothetical protein